MDKNRKSILDLNEDCQLEIMKYIIADCELSDKFRGNKINYANLVNLALAYEVFEAILKEYYNDLYEELEFVFVANRSYLDIDFSELLTTLTEKGEAFLRIYAEAIRENNFIQQVTLYFDPKSFQPKFLDHFEIVKRALENKKGLNDVRIQLYGYSLEDLNNFGHITNLTLDVRMSADALVNICKSNPHLENLNFISTEILGRLSDIVPHCCNLKKLQFVPKPDNDGAEYAPLAELPNLQEMTIFRAFENGSLLTLFEAITKWQRPEHQPLTVDFIEVLPHLSNVTIARMNALSLLELGHPREDYIKLLISYDFWDICRDSSPLEQSLATITLIEADLIIDHKGLALHECPTTDTDISGLVSLLKTFNIKTFKLKDLLFKKHLSKLFASMVLDESYALKSINTEGTEIYQFETSELVKIKSITSLNCQFSDWESVEPLSALTDLETVGIHIEEEFEKTYSKALCSLLNTCSASGVITCPNWNIEFKKSENILGQNKRIKTLIILTKEENADVFEAFSYRDLITIEELDVSECTGITIKEILKVADVQPITKLRISLTNTNDIERLSDLTELNELTICDSEKGSLIELFHQLVTKVSPSLQCLEINSKFLSTEELILVSRIRSLKKLDICDYSLNKHSSLVEVANSNIEELTLTSPHGSLRNLFAAFGAKSTTRLQHLNIKSSFLTHTEFEELSKIKSLRRFQCKCPSNVSSLRNFNHSVQLNIRIINIRSEQLQCLAELEHLECLTISLNNLITLIINNIYVDFLRDLANIQNLRKLNLIVEVDFKLTNVYQALASKSRKLIHLFATIGCVEELNEITRIKSLQNLILLVRQIGKKLTSLEELLELKSLRIIIMNHANHTDTIDSLPSILKCCRNLDRLIIDAKLYFYDTSLVDIYTIIRSVRDPTLQGPLTVIVAKMEYCKEFYDDYNIPEILVTLFENAYMKVFISSDVYLHKMPIN
nr:uncharacterized protein LOC108082695 [Drosophila kikkawai]